MNMCEQTLATIYGIHRRNGMARILFVERRLSPGALELGITEDSLRNAPELYATMFSGGCRRHIQTLLTEAIHALTRESFDEASDVFGALMFVQEASAIALWKYRQDVGMVLEAFTREFDRLDQTSVKRQLFQRAQSGSIATIDSGRPNEKTEF